MSCTRRTPTGGQPSFRCVRVARGALRARVKCVCVCVRASQEGDIQAMNVSRREARGEGYRGKATGTDRSRRRAEEKDATDTSENVCARVDGTIRRRALDVVCVVVVADGVPGDS